MARAHVAALGGNALLSYRLNECVLIEHPHKNQVSGFASLEIIQFTIITATWFVYQGHFVNFVDHVIQHMWQSHVEIEDYSVAHFNYIATFEAPYC